MSDEKFFLSDNQAKSVNRVMFGRIPSTTFRAPSKRDIEVCENLLDNTSGVDLYHENGTPVGRVHNNGQIGVRVTRKCEIVQVTDAHLCERLDSEKERARRELERA